MLFFIFRCVPQISEKKSPIQFFYCNDFMKLRDAFSTWDRQSHVKRTILYAPESQKESMSDEAPTPSYTCDVNHLFHIVVEKNLLLTTDIFLFSIQKLSKHFSEDFRNEYDWKQRALLTHFFANVRYFWQFPFKMRKNIICIFLIFPIEKHFRKHSDTITKTSEPISNENGNFHFLSFSMIFYRFSIVQVTVDLDTQIFPEHFETTILHHVCRTFSRQ